MNPRRLAAGIRTALGHFVVIILGLMVVNVTWQVASRYLIGQPSAWTEEIARFLLIWLGLFGGAYASAYRDHIALDLLPMEPRWRRVVQAGSMSALGLILVVGGAWLVRFTVALEQKSAALGLPLYCVYFAAPLSGALILFFALTPVDLEPASDLSS